MESIQWHPVFAAAIKLELREYRDILNIIEEYQLNEKPLAVDILVIKKLSDRKILVNIAQIFTGHNIIEFKSPSDYLCIDDYYKVKAYAYIYKSQAEMVDGIKIDDMSITMVSSGFPRELAEHLKNARGMNINEQSDGIYYLEGDDIKAQIVVIEELPPKVNKYVKMITRKLKEVDEALEIMDEFDENTKDTEIGVLTDFITKRHMEAIMEVLEMGIALKLTEEQLARLDAINERAGRKQKYVEEKEIEIARKMLKTGDNIEKVQMVTDLSLEKIQQLTKEV